MYISLFVTAFFLMVTALQGAQVARQESEPCILVIFGASGDLTARKLLPAVYNLTLDSRLSPNFAVVGYARGNYTDETFRQKMNESLDLFSRNKPKNEDLWKSLGQRIFYHKADYAKGEGYESLRKRLEELDAKLGTRGNRVFYLATPASQIAPIIRNLHDHQLIYAPTAKTWSKVIIEKPFGSDLKSALKLDHEISKYLDNSQVYLMDHYLGKEGTQSLIELRFQNGFFEPLWNHTYIDHVEITLSEEIGICTRASFWEETGSLRDVVQNHVFQLLALTAMEPPKVMDAAHLHAEKINVLHALRPIADLGKDVIRGQYVAGNIKGTEVLGYKQEHAVSANSEAETFVAAKLYIDTPRWKNVPFYIRAGKRLHKQTTEIAIVFKHPPNVLYVRIQPNANIFLKTFTLAPLKPSHNTFTESYEELLLDCIKGDHSLYVEAEEHLAAWRLLTPVLQYWKSHPENMQVYEAGSWGPTSANQCIQWQLIEN